MSDSTLAAPTRASGKKSSAPKAVKRPIPAPISPIPEGDRLALQGAEALQELVLYVRYDRGDERRTSISPDLSMVDHLLGRLLAPDHHDRKADDPETSDICDHLASIAAHLEDAMSSMECGIPDSRVDEFMITIALTSYAYHYADELFAAYNGLPGTLEALRALTTQAGAHAAIERHLASDLAARLRADVPAQQSATADAPNADEKLVAATVAANLHAIYDKHWRELPMYGIELLISATDKLDCAGKDSDLGSVFHLAAALIQGCIRIAQIEVPGHSIIEPLQAEFEVLNSASIGYTNDQEPCEALATGIRAGVKRHRDPPQPPIRRVDKDLSAALSAIAVRASTLSCFLWDAHTTAEANGDSRGANDFLVAEGLAKFIGTIADEANGFNYIGGALDWADDGSEA